jgi:hypothetical protein
VPVISIREAPRFSIGMAGTRPAMTWWMSCLSGEDCEPQSARNQTPVTFALFSWTWLTPMLSLGVDVALKVSPRGFPD